jgi:hypothetical protein
MGVTTCSRSLPSASRRMKTRSFGQAVTVFLSDYIDRGRGPMRVIEQLASAEWPTSVIALAGNHEDFLLAFLDDAAILDFWGSQGGLEPLHSVDVGAAMAGRNFAYATGRLTCLIFGKRPAPFLKSNAAMITVRCRGQSTEAKKTFNSGRVRDIWGELNVEASFRRSSVGQKHSFPIRRPSGH